MSATFPHISTLAAIPPQKPSHNQENSTNSTSLPSRPSNPEQSPTTSNYASAVAAARQKHNKPGAIDVATTSQFENEAGAKESGGLVSPTSASWRPNFNRQQSWSQQDMKRAMQSPLMSPSEEKKEGFTSSDTPSAGEN